MATEMPADLAPWRVMELGASVTLPDQDPPSCYVNEEGEVFLRGHVDLSPVPALGGQLLAVLPIVQTQVVDSNTGATTTTITCPCSPEHLDVIATSTALAEHPGASPDVCIVRMLVTRHSVPADVNRDTIIDNADIKAVLQSPYFTPNASQANASCGTQCGNADVNRDGYVSVLDITSIYGSVMTFPTSVVCGAVYATAFSCGSTRSAPVTPALAISLDNMGYFDDDGVAQTRRTSYAKMSEWNGYHDMLQQHTQLIDVLVERMQSMEQETQEKLKHQEHKMQNQQSELRKAKSDMQQKFQEQESELQRTKLRQAELESKLASDNQTRDPRSLSILVHLSAQRYVQMITVAVAVVVVAAIMVVVSRRRRLRTRPV